MKYCSLELWYLKIKYRPIVSTTVLLIEIKQLLNSGINEYQIFWTTNIAGRLYWTRRLEMTTVRFKSDYIFYKPGSVW